MGRIGIRKTSSGIGPGGGPPTASPVVKGRSPHAPGRPSSRGEPDRPDRSGIPGVVARRTRDRIGPGREAEAVIGSSVPKSSAGEDRLSSHQARPAILAPAVSGATGPAHATATSPDTLRWGSAKKAERRGQRERTFPANACPWPTYGHQKPAVHHLQQERANPESGGATCPLVAPRQSGGGGVSRPRRGRIHRGEDDGLR